MSDWAYPKIPRRRRGKRYHHGGDVCGLVVLGVDSTFRTIPTVGILRGGSFFVPARTQIVVKLLMQSHYMLPLGNCPHCMAPSA